MRKPWVLCGMLALAAALHIQDMPVMASPVPQAGVEAEEETGDDLDLIENGSTAYSQATPCQLTVTTECPEQFGQNTYVLLTDDEGKNYRVSLLAENSHTDNIYLAPGHYRITDVAVFDDYKNEYPFDISVSEVNLSADEAAAVSFRLSDFDVIQSNADGAIWTDPSTEISEEYETGIAGVTITNSGNLVYPVQSDAAGPGVVKISGNATEDMDLSIRVVRTGITGEATCTVSVDGGVNVSGTTAITKDGLSIHGIQVDFESNSPLMQWVEGDTYQASVRESFCAVSDQNRAANIVALGHPLEDQTFCIQILSDGSYGNAQFAISGDGGVTLSEPIIIPADGSYSMDSDGITLYFSPGDFTADTTYQFKIESHDETTDYTPLYILAILVLLLIIFVIAYLYSQKESDSEYELKEYTGKSDPQKYT